MKKGAGDPNKKGNLPLIPLIKAEFMDGKQKMPTLGRGRGGLAKLGGTLGKVGPLGAF